MTSTPPTQLSTGDLFTQVLDLSARPDPYPLFARMRAEPVSCQAGGIWVVTTYDEISQLLHDPRISSDQRTAEGAQGRPQQAAEQGEPPEPPLLFRDPPEHDRLRRLVMNEFTPERINAMRSRIEQLVDHLLTDMNTDGEPGRMDIVDDFAYPLPVTVICDLLGVPHADEARFHEWASHLARGLDPIESLTEAEQAELGRASQELNGYLSGLLAQQRNHPGNNVFSGLATSGVSSDGAIGQDDPMSDEELLSTAVLLLIAGHETTVNLITNGMLTLLRHPEVFDRLRAEPDLAVSLTEELLRYEPPVQMVPRVARADIDIAGTRIPAGARVSLLLASGNRDPAHLSDADRFVPGRTGTTHLGFGGGTHFCIGAPLARLETQIALTVLARRLQGARLLADPPPYRDNAALRGPEHLPVAFDSLAP
jgi:cytochrome P450